MMFFSIFLISFSLLAYEIIIMRIFSITQWHHFAYMIISIALLGFGVSGTFISILRPKIEKRIYKYYLFISLLYPLSTIICYILSQKIPFNPFLLVWYPEQLFYLFEYYICLFIPFFLGASCICLAFIIYKDDVQKVYFLNLVGSGLGALSVVLVMFCLSPTNLIIVNGVIAFISSIIVLKKAMNKTIFVILLFIIILFLLLYYYKGINLNISEYKWLNVTLNAPDSKVVYEDYSPFGLISVVSSPTLRYAPGLSLNYHGEIPKQLGLFIDADSMSAITEFNGDLSTIKYLDYQSPSLPYHLLDNAKVLILGAGGGADVLSALYHSASSITALEINPQVIDIVKERFREFSGEIYNNPKVNIENVEGRSFLRSHYEKYDLIQLSLLDSFSASSSGVYSLNESYIYTVEAFKDYLNHLTSNGILSITRWVKIPPRDSLKIFSTAIDALNELGYKDIQDRLVFIRSWATTTILIKNSKFTEDDIGVIRSYCEQRNFDTEYFPGITKDEINRFNKLKEPIFYNNILKILSNERREFYKSYVFNIMPATDNKPFFFHFFKWESLPMLLKKMGREWIPFVEWGYIILIITLVQAILFGMLLVFIPFLFKKRVCVKKGGKWNVFIYFFGLGLGYLFIEMPFIQKFIQFLGNPIFSISVIISSFLFFSGIGAIISQRLPLDFNKKLVLSIMSTIIISLIYILILDKIFSVLISLKDLLKIIITIILISPLSFFMGMPFPLGLKRISDDDPSMIPWAWAINGFASVLSAILATLIAISLGFRAVVFIATAIYLTSLLCFRYYTKL